MCSVLTNAPLPAISKEVLESECGDCHICRDICPVEAITGTPWHDHKDTDEVFLVINGKMQIELQNETVKLSAGEMYVVPRGIQHRPIAEEECHIMLIEPRGVINIGEADSNLQAENDVWI